LNSFLKNGPKIWVADFRSSNMCHIKAFKIYKDQNIFKSTMTMVWHKTQADYMCFTFVYLNESD